MSTLYCDPGFAEKSGFGWAFFPGPRVTHAGVVWTPPDMPLRHRAQLIRNTIAAALASAKPDRPNRYVIELPRIYPMQRQKGDPNDIVDLAYVAGALDDLGFPGELITPRDWKGTMKADAMTRWIVGRLEPEEKAIVEKIPKGRRHNAVDAIGLGLHDHGRLR
jgi:hypothetical protein